jgi:carbon-monoxide dehydrogenase small subunit
MTDLKRLRIKLNGSWREVETRPDRILLDSLREDLGLTGTKKGCEQGECGACTIIMDGKAVLSCLIPAFKADGAEILTIEGMAVDGRLHPLQQAFWEDGAVQCGYCTPGMLLSAKALLDEVPEPGIEEVKKAISGNLCRCTGYTKIVRAIQSAADHLRKGKGQKLAPE